MFNRKIRLKRALHTKAVAHADYSPTPRQLGFANQIIFSQMRQRQPWPPSPTPPSSLPALGKAALDVPACPGLPAETWGLPGPFVPKPLERVQPPWGQQGAGKATRAGGQGGPGALLVRFVPQPLIRPCVLYGPPRTSGLGKAAFPCAPIDLPAPGSGCCPG